MNEQPGYGYRGEGEPQANPPVTHPREERRFPPRAVSHPPQSPVEKPFPAGGIPQVAFLGDREPHRHQESSQVRAGAPRPAMPPRQSGSRDPEIPQPDGKYRQANPAPDPLPATLNPAAAPLDRTYDSLAVEDYDAPTSVYGSLPSNVAAPQSNFTASWPRVAPPSDLAGTNPAAASSSPLLSASYDEEDEMDQEIKSSRRSPLWLLYGLVVLVLIALVSWQIVRLSTGKVPSAVPLGSQAEVTKIVAAPEPKPIATTQTEQVKKVLAAQPVAPAQLGGDKKRVTFRSQSGIIVCTIAEKLEDTPPPLVPLAVDGSGAFASGNGVVCATASNFDAAGNIGKCQQGDLRLSVLGLWDASSGIGACVNGTTPLYEDVKSGQRDNSGKRFDLQSLGPGQYTQLGKYACTFGGTDTTCVNVSTGKGFTFTDLGGYQFF